MSAYSCMLQSASSLHRGSADSLIWSKSEFDAENYTNCMQEMHAAESPAYKLPVFLLQLRNLLSVKMAVF